MTATAKLAELPEQTVALFTTGMAGRGVTVTVTVLRLLTQTGAWAVAAST